MKSLLGEERRRKMFDFSVGTRWRKLMIGRRSRRFPDANRFLGPQVSTGSNSISLQQSRCIGSLRRDDVENRFRDEDTWRSCEAGV